MLITRRAALACAISALAPGQDRQAQPYPDAPYVPTPFEVVEAMLKLANLGKGDVVYDLGSGDGRIVIMAAEQFGAAATGVEIDPEMVRRARENAAKAGVGNKVRFLEADLFETDLRSASVVTLYLLPNMLETLKPKLRSQLKPGARVVCFHFDITGWKPAKTARVNGRPVYLYIIGEESK